MRLVSVSAGSKLQAMTKQDLRLDIDAISSYLGLMSCGRLLHCQILQSSKIGKHRRSWYRIDSPGSSRARQERTGSKVSGFGVMAESNSIRAAGMAIWVRAGRWVPSERVMGLRVRW